jgi:hypothetical protein
VAAGYRGSEGLKSEEDLEPLHSRADFRVLVAELERNQPPAKK